MTQSADTGNQAGGNPSNFTTEQQLELTKLKLESSEKTLRTLVGYIGVLLTLAIILTSIASYFNSSNLRDDFNRLEKTIQLQLERADVQLHRSAASNENRIGELGGAVDDKVGLMQEQVNQALKMAQLLPGEPSIHLYYRQSDLGAAKILARDVPNSIRIYNDGDGTTTEITAIFYFSNLYLQSRNGYFYGDGQSDEDAFSSTYTFDRIPPLQQKQSHFLQFPQVQFTDSDTVMAVKLKVYFGGASPVEADFTIGRNLPVE